MKRSLFLLGLASICLSASIASATVPVFQDKDFQNRLNDSYKDKIYILRHPINKESQHYSADGQLISTGSEGTWTIYGAVQIKKISVDSRKLHIQGHRLIYSYDFSRKDLLPKKVDWDKSNVYIDVDLSHQVSSPDEVNSILHRVFTFNETELIETVPDYWHPFLSKQISSESLANKSPELSKRTKASATGNMYPEVLKAPMPEINEVALRFQARGVVVLDIVVDQNGAVSQPTIFRPAGFGLDEQAITAVQAWKFKPAIRDGQPVSVHMMIEAAF